MKWKRLKSTIITTKFENNDFKFEDVERHRTWGTFFVNFNEKYLNPDRNRSPKSFAIGIRRATKTNPSGLLYCPSHPRPNLYHVPPHIPTLSRKNLTKIRLHLTSHHPSHRLWLGCPEMTSWNWHICQPIFLALPSAHIIMHCDLQKKQIVSHVSDLSTSGIKTLTCIFQIVGFNLTSIQKMYEGKSWKVW